MSRILWRSVSLFALAPAFLILPEGISPPERGPIPEPRVAALQGEVRYEGSEVGPIVVQAFRLRTTRTGRAVGISKADILGGAEPLRTVRLPAPGPFTFSDLEEGPYSVVAFMDLDGDGALDFDPPEPFGWHALEAAGWVATLELGREGTAGVDILLRRPRPFPARERRTEHGALLRMKGIPVLQLHGTATERGFAHGYLVGEQILDFFEFYVLEDSWRSAGRYQEEYVPFLESHFDYDPDYVAEVDAVVEGMRASGMDMSVPWLGRDFERVDLLAINAYIERRAARPSPSASGAGPEDPFPAAASTPVDEPRCSQFAAWGEATRGGELEGGLIAGRNMDGEVDLRKVTVSHFLLFAVDPAEPGRHRWISTMWPGFVGTLSGINEEGLYSMENAGGTGPGPVVDGLTPCTWVQRYILENAGGESTPGSIGEMIDGFRSAGGGTFGPGSIILWGVPYRGQEAPAFVSEGDRFGTAIRGPAEVAPTRPFDIMATNHFRVYGVDPDQPDLFFGKETSFSSLWRYEAGMNRLEAWARKGTPMGTEEIRSLLKGVAHGTTEYAVIFRANEMTVDVAVDDLATDLWDAPFRPWVTFTFEELFHGMR